MEDDPVVKEVDVYLSKQLASNLFLFQYPLRPASSTYENVSHYSAKVKPKQQRVEMELEVNTRSANYDTSKGEQVAVNVENEQGAYYPSGKMDKQILSSTRALADTSRYVVGLFRDGELHVTPLKGILQIRPSFNYLDMADAKQKAAGGEEAQDEEEEAKPVTMKFEARESSEAKARRLASFEYMTKKNEEERWVHLHHHQQYESISASEYSLLLARQGQEVTEFESTHEAYLEQLIPKMKEDDETKPALPSNVLSLTELKSMTLGDQIKALLINAKVMRFTQLMSLLPKGTDTTTALRFLQQVAMLVQGCWVVKSEILYPKDSHSRHSGVQAEALWRARDYVMWRFTQSRIVVRKDIASVVRLISEDLKDILEQMAQVRIKKGWEFIMPFDSEFVGRHPEVLQRQQMLWDAKFQQLSKVLKITKNDLDRRAKAVETAGQLSPEKPKRRRTISRSRTKSGSERQLSFSDMSDNEGSRDGSRNRHGSGAERSRRVSTSSRGSDCLMSPPRDTSIEGPSLELKKALLTFVQEKLQSRLVLTISDLKRLFSLKQTECPPGHILGSGVDDMMLERAALESGCRRIYVNGEATYAAITFKDGHDYLRQAVIDGFDGSEKIRLTALKKSLEENCGSPPPENDIRKILRDYCVSKPGGYWVLKTSANS